MRKTWAKAANLLRLGTLIVGTLFASSMHAQLYVANYLNSTVGEYDPNSGAAINATLVSGAISPIELAISGNNLYVANDGSDSIGLYNLTTGAAINPSFVTGINPLGGMVVSGSTLYAASGSPATSGAVSTWNANTGAAISASFLTIAPQGGSQSRIESLAISGNNLYVSYSSLAGSGVGEFNATTGAAINASLIPMTVPAGMSISGNDLYAINQGDEEIDE